MTDEELKRRMKAYVMGWKETGEFLDAERRERVREADTAQSMRALGGLFDHAVRRNLSRPSSGLEEFYQILMRSGDARR
jgi:hypothetical protein